MDDRVRSLVRPTAKAPAALRQKIPMHLVAEAVSAAGDVAADEAGEVEEEAAVAAMFPVLLENPAQSLLKGGKKQTKAARPTTTGKRSVARRWPGLVSAGNLYV